MYKNEIETNKDANVESPQKAFSSLFILLDLLLLYYKTKGKQRKQAKKEETLLFAPVVWWRLFIFLFGNIEDQREAKKRFDHCLLAKQKGKEALERICAL